MSTHPIRMRDVVVVLPGITGSVLSRTGGGDVWAFSGSAIWNAAKSLGGSLKKELNVPLHDPRREKPKTGLKAKQLVPNFHGVFGLGKIDGYTDLRRMVTDHFSVVEEKPGGNAANYFEFPYDWRLSNRASAKQLRNFIKPRLRAWREHRDGDPDAKLVLVAHSMGGLVARWYLEVLGGWKNCRALITFGTPYRGSVNSLNFLANGYKGRFLDLTDVLRSCPSVYELLPIYQCVHVDGAWERPGECGVPNAVSDYVGAAVEFHQTIQDMVKKNDADHGPGRYHIFPFLGGPAGFKTAEAHLLYVQRAMHTHAAQPVRRKRQVQRPHGAQGVPRGGRMRGRTRPAGPP
jgi:pimeloyl-ACP methyl ester carboxylesterase